MREFKGKVAVVTGGASGIGRAMADRLAREGMNIVLADIEGSALSAAVDEMKSGGASVIGVKTDVARQDQLDALAARTISEFGAVHILCNNAGVGGDAAPIWELELETWKWVLGVNLWGVIHGIRSFVPAMIRHGSEGHVVNTASMAGLLSVPYIAPYHTTKHAVVSLSEALHHELQIAGSKIRVSVLCPSFVRTNIMESQRNRPEDLRVADREKTPAELALDAAIRGGVESGIPPSDVADTVFDAISEEQFYIFPHSEALESYRTYTSDVLEQRNPALRLEELSK